VRQDVALPNDSEEKGYFSTRYTQDPRRDRVWKHIVGYLQRYVPDSADVLELGAGYCDFSNFIHAGTRTAIDLDPVAANYAGPGVHFEVGDCSDLSRFSDESFDVAFASNLVEHLDRARAVAMLKEIHRVLRPDGRIILMQPNYRLRPGEYFDDYTHVAIYTDRSLPDFLKSESFNVKRVMRRFLPLTMKSRGAGLHVLVPLYLRSPFKPFAGQMLVVAEK